MTERENRKKNFDLLAMGELLLRLSPPGNDRITRGDTFEKHIGGAELNVAAGVSLLGLRTGMISEIPDSAIGEFAKNKIRYLGVSDDYLVWDRDEDARLGVYYYESARFPRKPQVVYDRKHTSITKVDIDSFPEEMFSSTRCFHISGITLALNEKARACGIEMIKRFKEHGALISFDVNFRLNLWSGAEAKACIEQILPYVDIFFCSEDTARLTFLKEGTLQDIMREFTREYPISIMASTQRIVHSPKLHTFGSVIYEAKSDTFYQEKPYEKIDVVDRIGSGEAYCGGVVYGLLTWDRDCAKALAFGNACSAVKNTIPGDLPSSDLKEIEYIIEDHNTTGRHAEMNR